MEHFSALEGKIPNQMHTFGCKVYTMYTLKYGGTLQYLLPFPSVTAIDRLMPVKSTCEINYKTRVKRSTAIRICMIKRLKWKRIRLSKGRRNLHSESHNWSPLLHAYLSSQQLWRKGSGGDSQKRSSLVDGNKQPSNIADTSAMEMRPALGCQKSLDR